MGNRSTSLHVGFWNTWLLHPRLWSGGPAAPGGARVFAPEVQRRAPLVGTAIRDRFDLMALAECFETTEQEAVANAWPGATMVRGPGRKRVLFSGSGLATMVNPAQIELVHTAEHAYRAGGDLRDSDTLATKGALLTRVRVGDVGELDLFSTHLFAGGDLLPLPRRHDTGRHHLARMRQVDELVSFIERERQPSNPVLLVGDLNVCAHDHDAALHHPSDRYQDLSVRLRRIGLRDIWADHGVGHGHSCTFTDASDLPPEPSDADQVADDPNADPATSPGERIDYLWLAPAPDGSVEVGVERPRRWAFSGRAAQGGPAGSLSDHLALSVTLNLSRR